MDWLKQGAATITAVAVVVGVTIAVAYMTLVGTVSVEAAFAFLGPIVGGAGVFLWNQKAAQDATEAALAQPQRGG